LSRRLQDLATFLQLSTQFQFLSWSRILKVAERLAMTPSTVGE